MFSYLYFCLALYFFFWWVILFFWKKENRREMFYVGLLGLLAGPAVQIMHLRDWWHPVFLYNNFPIKIEDMIFGFAVAGVSAAIYESLREIGEKNDDNLVPSVKYQFLVFIVGIFILFGFFYVFGIHSFWTSILCLITIAIFILAKRPDLFLPMFYSGVLVTVIAWIFYILALQVNPEWFVQEWYLNNLSGIFVGKIPIEELTWYFFTGLTFSTLWEFVCGIRFVGKK
ncbi:MAG: lycopene cyclase domain-containing protein [bacterium]